MLLFRSAAYVEPARLHAEARWPVGTPAREQNLSVSGGGTPLRQKLHILAIVKDQQPRQRTAPRGQDKSDLLGLRQFLVIFRAAAPPQRATSPGTSAALAKLSQKTPPAKNCPVAMRKLARKLRLADAAKARRPNDGSRVAGFDAGRELFEILLASDE
jgi:hypothetical protein